jgi:hypothetical protein
MLDRIDEVGEPRKLDSRQRHEPPGPRRRSMGTSDFEARSLEKALASAASVFRQSSANSISTLRFEA